MDEEQYQILPPLSTDEFEALRSSIKRYGVRDPIIEDEFGNVLDGRHRLKIDPDAPRRKITGLTEAEKLAFVFQVNFARRNLSPDQRAECRDKQKQIARQLREEDPKKNTQQRVAEMMGVSRQLISHWWNETTNKAKIGNTCTSDTSTASPSEQDEAPPTSSPQPQPDARVKMNAAAKREAVKRVLAGESQAQVAADYSVSQQQISNLVKAHRAEQEESDRRRREAEEAEMVMAELDDMNVKHGDFRELAPAIEDNSVSLIFTDPPYDRKTLPLYGELAQVAERILVPGGSLICYLGQYQIGEVINQVSPHLRLWWTLAVRHAGPSFARMNEHGVVVKWKPMLWFVKGTRRDKQTFVDDLIESRMEKSHHDWQQSVIEASYYIERLTKKDELVFDPFCGGATTAVACEQLGRRWLTCDVDAATVKRARDRLTNGGAK